MAEPTPSARSAHLAGLLARTARADEAAFAELYRQTASHLYAVALRMLREPAAAEETLQEAFVSVWHHAGSYVPSLSQPQTWLASVVRNRCLDRLRRREPDTVPLARDDDDGSELDLPAQGGSPDELLRAAADARSVRACVEGLEGGQRQAIALAFYRGMTHAEVALHLGVPLGTAKSWVRRGLARLKDCLDETGVTP